MSCEISNGRLEACKDSTSGIKSCYIINYDKLNSDSVTYLTASGSEDVIEAWTPIDDSASMNLYKFELKSNANSFTTTINSDRNNGTTFFTQTLVINLKRQDAATTKNVKLLSYGRPRIVIRTMTDQFFLMGLDQGADVSAGEISTGAALGDFNGYSLTFTAEEELPANFLDCNTEAGLKLLFATVSGAEATIVTS
jgi:hypothetical protein|tara:strand:+ start:284 stop:871 length:588 start_codon:yes stop_codon:yes gene_type:complete